MKTTTLKITLPVEKFEEPVILAYIDDMPPILNDHDDSENAVHEEGLNEILIGFFGNRSNDDDNYHMVDSNDDSKGNYHQHNLDDNNLKDSIKQATKTPVFIWGASRTSKLTCTLILLKIKSLFGWSDKGFTILLTWVEIYFLLCIVNWCT